MCKVVVPGDQRCDDAPTAPGEREPVRLGAADHTPDSSGGTRMFDLVIRNGTIVDGTGADSFVGDVGVTDGRIVEVGSDLGAGTDEIDASGLLVTPGWVDIHT